MRLSFRTYCDEASGLPIGAFRTDSGVIPRELLWVDEVQVEVGGLTGSQCRAAHHRQLYFRGIPGSG